MRRSVTTMIESKIGASFFASTRSVGGPAKRMELLFPRLPARVLYQVAPVHRPVRRGVGQQAPHDVELLVARPASASGFFLPVLFVLRLGTTWA